VTDNYGLPLKKLYAEKGLELILVADVGWNDMVCKTACLTPDSVKGQKMRVSPSQASRVVFKQLGANGVQMPLTEFWPGLQSGLVVGADLPFLFYVTTPAAQSAPHYVMTRHYHHPSTFIVNKALFDGMKPALREKLPRPAGCQLGAQAGGRHRRPEDEGIRRQGRLRAPAHRRAA
jgi:TRAP-type transport system periplasmic protein